LWTNGSNSLPLRSSPGCPPAGVDSANPIHVAYVSVFRKKISPSVQDNPIRHAPPQQLFNQPVDFLKTQAYIQPHG
jgi:hypothetical protein